jgi:4-diphosphocytidyl-2-C-methyl-D-erythritol kinase
MPLERRSPCKINLLLNILDRRPDGFHELETIMQPVALYDALTFAALPFAEIQLTCSHADLPTDERNLVYRAAQQFMAEAQVASGIRIHLQKNIPLAAGLGGGSGNAATTLLALNELFPSRLSSAQLNDIAARLGSDIPFFLQSGPALGTGRGERIQPLPTFPALQGKALLLIHPGFGVSTRWAYEALRKHPDSLRGRPGRASALLAELRQGNVAPEQWYNALEAPVLNKYPILHLYQDYLVAHGAIVARMSGSGSTTFALFGSTTEAEAILPGFNERFGHAGWRHVVPIEA